MQFIDKCIQAAYHLAKKHAKNDDFSVKDLHVLSYSHAAGSYRALIGSRLPDGRIYTVLYDTHREATFVTAYSVEEQVSFYI